MKNFLLSTLLLFPLALFAQKKSAADPLPTPAAERMAGLQKKKELEKRSLVSNISFRSAGPTIMSGRVVDIEVDPKDATKFFVAYASGGLWYTDNNGTTFRPLFDDEASMTIGDFDVNWNAKGDPEIWVGTGEANSSRSSYAGTGVYYSNNMGKSWEHRGLEETHHIGKVLHYGSNVIYVGAIGHLYSPSKERGVYMSKDGGKTWTQTLFIDDNTGVIDIVPDPGMSGVLYACAWSRERRAWNFIEAGKGSGIYKTVDGEKWSLLTGPKSGFPQGDGVGRIGVTVFGGKEGNPHAVHPILYAVVDNQTPKAGQAAGPEAPKLQPEDFRKMSREAFLKLDEKKLAAFLDDNNFPANYSAEAVRNMVRANKIQPSALADYLEDANRALFSAPITGAEIYRSDNAGETWRKVNSKDLENFFFTYGYYFGKIWVSPHDENEVYIAGVTLQRSGDGGKTFTPIDGENQHGDHHALWIDPEREGHLINGNDGGVNISWDNGASWFKANTPAVGQFYSVNADMAQPYNVYGGLQDNGVWTGPSNYSAGSGWQNIGQYPYKFILGGDGMQVQIDTRDNNTVYAGYQFGYYFRINKTTEENQPVRPKHELGEKPLRFNWQAPIWLSAHNRDILYFGSNKLHRSLNKGEDWQTISADLTSGARAGDVPYGTLTSIHESPLRFGLLYTGSDDGLVHVTRDGGSNWIRISDQLPKGFRVNRVQASAHKEGRVYVALSGFQWDHFAPYLYVSEDFGGSWTKLGNDLPMEPINVVREDPENPELLYVGTDNGLYVSLDRGKSFMRMTGGLPASAVHDLVIQPREHDLVVGTHGRSIWIANVEALQQLRDTVLGKNIFAFEPKPASLAPAWKQVDGEWQQRLEAIASVSYYVKQPGVTTIRLKTSEGLVLSEKRDTGEAGLNFVRFDLKLDPDKIDAYEKELAAKGQNGKLNKSDRANTYPLEGEYVLELRGAQGQTQQQKLIVKRKKSRGSGDGQPGAED